MKRKTSILFLFLTAALGGFSFIFVTPNGSDPVDTAPVEPIPTYNRADYGSWIDEDQDCQNTRHEILISSSLIPVNFKTEKQCLVVAGQWLDSYTATTFTNSSQLDIDHIVPVKEAHLSGAYKWDKSRKEMFYNDTDNLLAVSRSANRSKGSKDPASWLPKNTDFTCSYIKKWVAIKQKYNLASDDKEQNAINTIMKEC